MLLILDLDHPYVKQFQPWIVGVAGKFEVRWRDFWTMRQEHECKTREDADEYVAHLRTAPHVVFLETHDGRFDWETIADADQFWFETARSAP